MWYTTTHALALSRDFMFCDSCSVKVGILDISGMVSIVAGQNWDTSWEAKKIGTVLINVYNYVPIFVGYEGRQ
eukprot:COSAG02_NODE_14997_length_1216_cov_1.332140_1_plen_73_part_00